MSFLSRLPTLVSESIIDFFWKPADPRPYAIVRIAFACAALLNWGELFWRRASYFGPHAMLDGDQVKKAVGTQPYFSVFSYAHQSDVAVTLVFLVALAAIVALGFGLYSRAAAFIVWIFHISYSHYAFAILHSWDAVLRAYAFLLLISPCAAAAAWSLDAKRAAKRGVATPETPIYGLRLMQWQLMVIYVATVWLKVPDVSWRNGRLLAFFQMSMYSRFPDLTILAKYEVLSDILTYASLAIELGVVFMLASARLRWLGVFLGVSLHAGIAVSARLTVFSLCIVAPYAAFFSGADVDLAEKVIRDWIATRRARRAAT